MSQSSDSSSYYSPSEGFPGSRSRSRSRTPLPRRDYHRRRAQEWEFQESVQDFVDAMMDLRNHEDTVHGLWRKALDLRRRIVQNGVQPKPKSENESLVCKTEQAPSEPAFNNWIGTLYQLCQTKLKRPDPEIRFTTEVKEIEKGENRASCKMFQSTVDSKHFTGSFVGDLCSSKKAAKHSAARVAIGKEFPAFELERSGQGKSELSENRKDPKARGASDPLVKVKREIDPKEL